MQAAEAEPVAVLIRTAFAAIAVPLDPAPSALRVTAADVAAQLQAGGGAVWDVDGVRGCVLWKPKGEGLYLGRLAVQPGWQGRGIARHLLDVVEAAARAQGMDRVLLEVRLALAGNRRLFAAAGFTETALRAHPGHAAPTYAEAEKLLV